MGNNFNFLVEPDGVASDIFRADPLMLHSLRGHWLSHIVSFVGNSRNVYMHGSFMLQEAISCMSNLSGALLLWLATGSIPRTSSKIQGDHIFYSSGHSTVYTPAKQISSVGCDLTGFFLKKGPKRKPSVFDRISNFTLKQFFQKAEWMQSCPMLSLAAALVPPFTIVETSVLAIPQDIDVQLCKNHRPQEIENCGHGGDLLFPSFDLSKKMIEPKTGIEFPTVLDSSLAGGNGSSFTSEVLVGTGSRIMTIIKIKSLKVYAFGFYVHPFDVCEKLGPKYACIPEYELNKHTEFYQDLLREDINMTIRLVINCNGIKISTVKDAFEKSLRARLIKTNPDTDLSCLQAFGSLFSQEIPLHVGTIVNFRRTADGNLITEVGGNRIGAVQNKDLCRAFFDMYIGDIPVCEKTKEEIGKNVANLIRVC